MLFECLRIVYFFAFSRETRNSTRRKSVILRSVQTPNSGTDEEKEVLPARPRLPPRQASLGAVEQEGTDSKMSGDDEAIHHQCIGSIVFVGVLKFTQIKGHDLLDADLFSQSDPYIIFKLGYQTIKTGVIMDNNNPEWNETIIFSWDGKQQLSADVYDLDDAFSDDYLGSCTINLAPFLRELRDGKKVTLTAPLQRPEFEEKGTLEMTCVLDTFK